MKVAVRCAVCDDERMVYPSRVKRVQLCSKVDCWRLAKINRLIAPGGAPRRATTFRNGIEGRVCPQCIQWRPLTGYPVHVRNPDGSPLRHESRCRACRREYQRDYDMDRKALRMLEAAGERRAECKRNPKRATSAGSDKDVATSGHSTPAWA